MVYEVNVKNKKTRMNCFVYETNEYDKLMLTLQNLSYLDKTKYIIDIKNKED